MIALLSALALAGCAAASGGAALATGPAALPGDPKPADVLLASDEEPPTPALREALLDAAVLALTDGEDERAAGLLEFVLENDADDSSALFLLGVTRLGQGDLIAAQDFLLRADELSPDDPSTLSLLARLAYDLEGPEAARAQLERVVELEDDDPAHWANLGVVCVDLREIGAALDAFQRALTLAPEHVAAHRGLGRLYGLVGEPGLAERSWRTALELDAQDPVSWLSLGHALRDQGRLPESLSAYVSAQELMPGDPWVAANVGSVMVALGHHADARDVLMDAVAGLDGHPEDQALALHDLGSSQLATGDLRGAEESWDEAARSDPWFGRAHASLGELMLDLGREAEAREPLQRAFECRALPADLAYELVVLHERAGDREAARLCARPLLGESDDPMVLVQRARVQLASRDPELRDVAAAEAVLIELLGGPLKDHGAGWALLAQALSERGALAEAVDALDEALQCSDDAPGRLSWRARRARLQERMGRD